MKLEDIGFYTLSDYRAENCSANSSLYRCELILTERCNFSCRYCKSQHIEFKKEYTYDMATNVVDLWTEHNLKNIRFSGGEPTIFKDLVKLVDYTKSKGVERIAISTNGSNNFSLYEKLIEAGVNDFSISLDACCSDFGDKMSGVKGSFDKVVANIVKISKLCYTTVGVVLTEETAHTLTDVVSFAHNLGVSDIRIISAAQSNDKVKLGVEKISQDILDAHPILKYRVNNILNGVLIRGLRNCDTNKCPLVLDDMAVMGDYHFPCVIYMREQGNPIGKVSKNMRQERLEWFKKHDTKQDTICKFNCLDVCSAHCNKVMKHLGNI